MGCSLKYESNLYKKGISTVAGVDEAGRGPLAGPVVAAAVILPLKFSHGQLDDSKKLSPRAREKIYGELSSDPEIHWHAAVVGTEEIDRLNILRATHQAMRLAVLGLGIPPVHALIDGLEVHPFPLPQTALVGGDGLSLSIAAASVIAKVTRDRIMLEMHGLYPEYAFNKHKGYSTPEHLAMLHKHGPCPIHRRSFEPVAQCVVELRNGDEPASGTGPTG
jgi:ribonuclease HII